MRRTVAITMLAVLLVAVPAAVRAATAPPAIDYLAAARRFADCMLRYGRDRYGTQHTPLFAVLLVRGKEPRIGPEPVFARPSPYNTDNMHTPFRKYDFNKCLNYPPGLGSEGPHKVTLTGCDPYEDAALYAMLIDLSRATGDPRYKAEAEKALRWWFTHTQSPQTGLYPWGEHLGWDFEHECPTYFEGPSKHLYAACYHEIKDRVPFLDFLATLPAPTQGERTPLERYALGVWNAHYWDKTKAVYCRHGDYTGRDDRTGSLEGYPAHQGAHLRLWAKAYRTTRDPAVRSRMADVLTKVLDVQIARARTYGFIPMTFKPDLAGKTPKRTSQSDRLGRHAAEVSVTLRDAAPAIAEKMADLARLLLGKDEAEAIMARAIATRNTNDETATTTARFLDALRSLGMTTAPPAHPDPTVADLAKADAPNRHADAILRRLHWYRAFGDAAYLEAAEAQARRAFARFMDETSPLPKAYDPPKTTTVAGEPFPDFTFRGARLMHAFALLGEALGQAGR